MIAPNGVGLQSEDQGGMERKSMLNLDEAAGGVSNQDNNQGASSLSINSIKQSVSEPGLLNKLTDSVRSIFSKNSEKNSQSISLESMSSDPEFLSVTNDIELYNILGAEKYHVLNEKLNNLTKEIKPSLYDKIFLCKNNFGINNKKLTLPQKITCIALNEIIIDKSLNLRNFKVNSTLMAILYGSGVITCAGANTFYAMNDAKHVLTFPNIMTSQNTSPTSLTEGIQHFNQLEDLYKAEIKAYTEKQGLSEDVGIIKKAYRLMLSKLNSFRGMNASDYKKTVVDNVGFSLLVAFAFLYAHVDAKNAGVGFKNIISELFGLSEEEENSSFMVIPEYFGLLGNMGVTALLGYLLINDISQRVKTNLQDFLKCTHLYKVFEKLSFGLYHCDNPEQTSDMMLRDKYKTRIQDIVKEKIIQGDLNQPEDIIAQIKGDLVEYFDQESVVDKENTAKDLLCNMDNDEFKIGRNKSIVTTAKASAVILSLSAGINLGASVFASVFAARLAHKTSFDSFANAEGSFDVPFLNGTNATFNTIDEFLAEGYLLSDTVFTAEQKESIKENLVLALVSNGCQGMTIGASVIPVIKDIPKILGRYFQVLASFVKMGDKESIKHFVSHAITPMFVGVTSAYYLGAVAGTRDTAEMFLDVSKSIEMDNAISSALGPEGMPLVATIVLSFFTISALDQLPGLLETAGKGTVEKAKQLLNFLKCCKQHIESKQELEEAEEVIALCEKHTPGFNKNDEPSVAIGAEGTSVGVEDESVTDAEGSISTSVRGQNLYPRHLLKDVADPNSLLSKHNSQLESVREPKHEDNNTIVVENLPLEKEDAVPMDA